MKKLLPVALMLLIAANAVAVATPTTYFQHVVINDLGQSTLIVANETKGLSSSVTTLAEASYLHGVTSAIQTQMNTKVDTIGAVGSSATGNAGVISGTTLTLEPAGATAPGVVTTGTQTLAGTKTFTSQIQANAGLSGNITGAVTGAASGNTTYTANQYGVVVSGSGNAMTVIAPDASTSKVLTSGGAAAVPTWASVASAPSSSSEISNVGLSAVISSNTLVLSLKQSDGSTNCASGSGACNIGVRATPAVVGGYSQASVTASMSITLAATDSIGWSLALQPLYAYFISDTTSEICLSATLFDDGALQSASALTGGADTSGGTLWCTSAHTSRPIRLLGSVAATWSNPNWSAITSVRMQASQNYISDKVYLLYTGNGGVQYTADTTRMDFANKVVDSHNAWSGTIFTAPRSAFYLISAAFRFTAGTAPQIYLYVNSVKKTNIWSATASSSIQGPGSAHYYLNAGDTLSLLTDSTATPSTSANSHWIAISSQ